jgi:hypothetical protein
MAFPDGWAGYDTITLPNPASALSDFPCEVGLPNLSATHQAEADSGGGIRVTDTSNNLIPSVVIRGATGKVVFKRSLADSGTQQVRIWSDKSGESAPAVDSEFGQHNAFPSHCFAYYPDGGGNDFTANANHLTMAGSPTVGDATGTVNGFVGTNYNGSDQEGADTSPSGAPASEPLSIMAWFQCDQDAGFYAVAAYGNASAPVDGYVMRLGGGTSSFNRIRASSTDGASAQEALSSSNFTAGAWTHGAAVFASTTSRIVYFNGTAENENTTSLSPAISSGAIRIGQHWRSAVDESLDGAASCVSFHDAVLSPVWVAYHLAMTSDLDQDSFYQFGGWTAHEGGGGGPTPSPYPYAICI